MIEEVHECCGNVFILNEVVGMRDVRISVELDYLSPQQAGD